MLMDILIVCGIWFVLGGVIGYELGGRKKKDELPKA